MMVSALAGTGAASSAAGLGAQADSARINIAAKIIGIKVLFMYTSPKIYDYGLFL
jgi:hypothetical protein